MCSRKSALLYQLLDVSPNLYMLIFYSQVKAETEKKPDVMTLSDSDDVQTISSGSDDNKEKEKVPLGKNSSLHDFILVSPPHSCRPAAGSPQV